MTWWRAVVLGLLCGIQADVSPLQHGADAHGLWNLLALGFYVIGIVLAFMRPDPPSVRIDVRATVEGGDRDAG